MKKLFLILMLFVQSYLYCEYYDVQQTRVITDTNTITNDWYYRGNFHLGISTYIVSANSIPIYTVIRASGVIETLNLIITSGTISCSTITLSGTVDGYDISTQFYKVMIDTQTLYLAISSSYTANYNAIVSTYNFLYQRDIDIGLSTGTLRTDLNVVKTDTGTLRTDLNTLALSTGSLPGTSFSHYKATATVDFDNNDLINGGTGYFNYGDMNVLRVSSITGKSPLNVLSDMNLSNNDITNCVSITNLKTSTGIIQNHLNEVAQSTSPISLLQSATGQLNTNLLEVKNSTGILQTDLATEVSNRYLADVSIGLTTATIQSNLNATNLSTGTLLDNTSAAATYVYRAGDTITGTLNTSTITVSGQITLKDGTIITSTSTLGDGTIDSAVRVSTGAIQTQLNSVAFSTGGLKNDVWSTFLATYTATSERVEVSTNLHILGYASMTFINANSGSIGQLKISTFTGTQNYSNQISIVGRIHPAVISLGLMGEQLAISPTPDGTRTSIGFKSTYYLQNPQYYLDGFNIGRDYLGDGGAGLNKFGNNFFIGRGEQVQPDILVSSCGFVRIGNQGGNVPAYSLDVLGDIGARTRIIFPPTGSATQSIEFQNDTAGTPFDPSIRITGNNGAGGGIMADGLLITQSATMDNINLSLTGTTITGTPGFSNGLDLQNQTITGIGAGAYDLATELDSLQNVISDLNLVEASTGTIYNSIPFLQYKATDCLNMNNFCIKNTSGIYQNYGVIFSSGDSSGFPGSFGTASNKTFFSWIPYKSSLWFGLIQSGANYSAANIGDYSLIGGQNNYGSGTNNLTFGNNLTTSGNYGINFGVNNDVAGNTSLGLGSYLNPNKTKEMVIGHGAIGNKLRAGFTNTIAIAPQRFSGLNPTVILISSGNANGDIRFGVNITTQAHATANLQVNGSSLTTNTFRVNDLNGNSIISVSSAGCMNVDKLYMDMSGTNVQICSHWISTGSFTIPQSTTVDFVCPGAVQLYEGGGIVQNQDHTITENWSYWIWTTSFTIANNDTGNSHRYVWDIKGRKQ